MCPLVIFTRNNVPISDSRGWFLVKPILSLTKREGRGSSEQKFTRNKSKASFLGSDPRTESTPVVYLWLLNIVGNAYRRLCQKPNTEAFIRSDGDYANRRRPGNPRGQNPGQRPGPDRRRRFHFSYIVIIVTFIRYNIYRCTLHRRVISKRFTEAVSLIAGAPGHRSCAHEKAKKKWKEKKKKRFRL